MFTGFSKIIEERIRKAQKKGVFENLEGAGRPLKLEEDSHIAEDLRLAHKILKNANCLPPEIELKKEIQRTEDLLSGMKDTAQKHRTLKKLNFLIMTLKGVILMRLPANSLADHGEQRATPMRLEMRLTQGWKSQTKFLTTVFF